MLHNGLGVVIHEKAIVKANVLICQNVTIGGGRGGTHPSGAATIEEGAQIGAGAVVLGPVRIGKNSKTGANSVVLTDVPDFATVTGVPATVKKITGKEVKRK